MNGEYGIQLCPAHIPAIRDGTGNVATHAIMAAFIAASGNPASWRQVYREKVYEREFGQPGAPGSVRVRFIAPAPKQDIFSTEGGDVVQELAGVDLDLVRWLDAKFAANGLTGKDGARIAVDAADYYRDRGTLKRGGGGVKREYSDAFNAGIERLGSLRIAGYVLYRGKREGKEPAPVTRAAFGREQPGYMPGQDEHVIRDEPVPFLEVSPQGRGYAVAFGTWYGITQRAFPRQRIESRLFALDDRSGRLAKRIGAYLEVQALVNSRKGVIDRRVSTVLEGAGVSRAPGERPVRFRARIERAFDSLRDVGLITEWTYRDGTPDTAAWPGAMLQVSTRVRTTETEQGTAPGAGDEGENE